MPLSNMSVCVIYSVTSNSILCIRFCKNSYRTARRRTLVDIKSCQMVQKSTAVILDNSDAQHLQHRIFPFSTKWQPNVGPRYMIMNIVPILGRRLADILCHLGSCLPKRSLANILNRHWLHYCIMNFYDGRVIQKAKASIWVKFYVWLIICGLEILSWAWNMRMSHRTRTIGEGSDQTPRLEPSPTAWSIYRALAIRTTDSKDSDQTPQMHSLI